MPMKSLKKKKEIQYKIYRQAAAKSRRLYFPVARRLHPSKIYPSRRLRIVRGAGVREDRDEAARFPSFLRLFPNGITEHWSSIVWIGFSRHPFLPSFPSSRCTLFPLFRSVPRFDCCLAEIRASGIFSGKREKSRARRDFHT